MDRYERLTELLKFLKNNERSESNFNSIYNKLHSEYIAEMSHNSNRSENHYLNNLCQTLNEQAEDYRNKKHKKPSSSHDSEFREFLKAFIADVEDELNRLRFVKPD